MPRVFCPATNCSHNDRGGCSARWIQLKRRVAITSDGTGILYECAKKEKDEETEEMMRLLGKNVRSREQKKRMV